MVTNSSDWGMLSFALSFQTAKPSTYSSVHPSVSEAEAGTEEACAQRMAERPSELLYRQTQRHSALFTCWSGGRSKHNLPQKRLRCVPGGYGQYVYEPSGTLNKEGVCSI